jgi:hypothetical protein
MSWSNASDRARPIGVPHGVNREPNRANREHPLACNCQECSIGQGRSNRQPVKCYAWTPTFVIAVALTLTGLAYSLLDALA